LIAEIRLRLKLKYPITIIMVRQKMKRWTYLIPILALVAIVATAAAPVEAQENEVTSIRPGGTYHIYVTAKKPSDMTLTTNWEIRFYLYNGLNCFTTGTSGDEGGWWNPSGDTWLYTGYWDHRVRNQSWGSTDERTWATYVPVIHSPASTNPADKEMRYPAPVGESYENKMGEIPVGSTIELRARFELRNLQNVTKDEANSTVTFKYGGKTYSSPYTLSTYGDINLDVGGNISQSEGTGEWSYRFDLNTTVLVDNNAPPTGKITMPGVLDVSFLTPSGGAGIPLWMIIVAVVVVLVFIVVAVVAVKMRGGATVSP
jgi:hypothetical protein